MNEQHPHLDDRIFQAFLEDDLDPHERGRTEAHLEGCPDCAVELELWRVLFQDLSDMPHLEPSPTLKERVGARIALAPERRRWGSRLAQAVTPEWLRRRRAHLRPKSIQDLLDGRVSPARSARDLAHARECSPCGEAVEDWRRVYTAVGSLGRLDPSPGFADAVMARCARVRVRASAPTTLADRVRNAVSHAIPKTRFGWSVAAAFAIGPLIGLAILVGAVVSSPVVRVADLVTFASWQIGEFARLAFATGVQRVLDVAAALDLGGIAATLASSPGLALSGVVTAWTAIAVSGWVLYRHLVAPYLSAERHAQSSN